MKKLIWLPVAGFLLIAGATVAAAAPTVFESARGMLSADVTDPSAGTTTTVGDELGLKLRPGALLEEVLADLVGDGTITQAQSDAITDALQAKIDEQKAEMEARREQMRATAEQVRGFLEDGVITQDEINQLPEDSPLREAFNSIAENGQITQEQLQNLGPGGFFRGPGGPGGHGHGHGFWFDGPDSSTDSDTSTDSSSDS